jgi:hypothetical protein
MRGRRNRRLTSPLSTPAADKSGFGGQMGQRQHTVILVLNAKTVVPTAGWFPELLPVAFPLIPKEENKMKGSWISTALLDAIYISVIAFARANAQYESALLCAYILAGIAIAGFIVCIFGVLFSAQRKRTIGAVLFGLHALLFLGLFLIADRGLFIGKLSNC